VSKTSIVKRSRGLRGARKIGHIAAFFLVCCASQQAHDYVPAPRPHLLPDFLRIPTHGDLTAPVHYIVELDTTRGPVHLEVDRTLAPYAADRFYTLVAAGFYDDVTFHRVVRGKYVSAGISGTPELTSTWSGRAIASDTPSVAAAQKRGALCLDSDQFRDRTTVFRVLLADDSSGSDACLVFGKALELDVLARIHDGYGDIAPHGKGPALGLMQNQGDPYLRAKFPRLDRIERALLVTKKQ
jgi:cyclophilin family peptidyl-prolyl cis-trans isomerase